MIAARTMAPWLAALALATTPTGANTSAGTSTSNNNGLTTPAGTPNALLMSPADACDQGCLACPGLADPEHYAEGSMKALRMITPGQERWLFRSETDLATDFGFPDARAEAWFRQLVSTLARQDTALVMILQPTRGLMHQDRLLADDRASFDAERARQGMARFQTQLRQAGAIVPDMLPLVEQPPEADYFFRRDHHWTPAGARATAERVGDALADHPLRQRLPAQTFVTEPGAVIRKRGSLNSGLGQICGNHYGHQYLRTYQTRPAQQQNQAALFGDPPRPEAVLVGTSNSAARDDDQKNYNFDGFLKQALATDVLNHALPGAGAAGALQQFLHSADYDPAQPPAAILWELPLNYRLDDPLMYRQLLPAVSGRCRGDRQIRRQTLPLPALQVHQRYEVLSNTGDQYRDLRGLDGYLDLRFSDPDLKAFYIITYYDNGERDKVWIRRPAAVAGGQYYLALSRSPRLAEANLLSVFIEPTQTTAAASEMEIRLCR